MKKKHEYVFFIFLKEIYLMLSFFQCFERYINI